MINKMAYVLFLAGICATACKEPRPPEAKESVGGDTEVQIFIGGLTAFVRSEDGKSVTALLVDARKGRTIKDKEKEVTICAHNPVFILYREGDESPNSVPLVGQQITVKATRPNPDTVEWSDDAINSTVDMTALYGGFKLIKKALEQAPPASVVARFFLDAGKVKPVKTGRIGFQTFHGQKKKDQDKLLIIKEVASLLVFSFMCDDVEFQYGSFAGSSKSIKYDGGKVWVYLNNQPEEYTDGFHSDFMFDLGEASKLADRFYPYTIEDYSANGLRWVGKPDCPIYRVHYYGLATRGE